MKRLFSPDCRAWVLNLCNIAISQVTTLYTAPFKKRTIAFILPIAEAGGGGNVIVQEMEAMRRFGVEPYVINELRNKDGLEKAYPESNTIYFGANGENSLAEVLEAKKYSARFACRNNVSIVFFIAKRS